MREFLQSLLNSEQFIPHGHCYLWKSNLVGLHLISDVLIGLAYYSIPLTLIYFLRKRRDVPFNWMFLLFSAFIIACGTTHLLEVWTLWHPVYWLSGGIKAVTAVLSLYTAVELVFLLPKALTLPNIAAANQKLEAEIAERRKTEQALRESEERFRNTFEQAAVGIAHASLAGQFLRLNQRFCDITGYSQSELVNLTFHAITHPDDLAADLEQVQNLLAGTIQTFALEQRYIRKDESIVWVNLTCSLMRDCTGEPKYLIGVIEDITTRKQAEEALQTSEERLRLALMATEQGLYDVNVQTGEVIVNDTYATMLGYDPAEFRESAADWLDRLHPDDRDAAVSLYRAYVAGEVSEYQLEFRLRTRRGGWKWILSLGKLVAWDAEGQPLRMLGTHTDISDRKQAEEERRRSQQLRMELQLLETILEVTLTGYWDWNIPEHQEYLSPTFKRMFGYADHELPNIPETWQQLIFPEDLPGVLECFNQHIQSRGQIPYYNEVRYRHRDGSTVWVICSGQVIEWDQEGHPLRMVGCHINITERKQAEQALKESEERWQLALRGSNASIWDWNFRTNTIFRSTRWKSLRGLLEDEVGNAVDEWWSQIHPEDHDRVMTALADHIAQKTEFYQQEYRVRHKDGFYIWILDRGQALWDETGNPVRMVGSETEISDRKQAEQALKESEARYRAIVEDQTELIARCLPDGTLIFVNGAYCRYFGLQQAEVIGTSYEPVVFAADRETVMKQLQALTAENPMVTIENRVIANGEIRWTQWINRLLFDKQGQVVEVQAVGRDISDRKQIEEQLRKSEATLLEAQKIAHIGSWEFDPLTGTINWSDEVFRIYGLEPGQPVLSYEEHLRQQFLPEDGEKLNQAVIQALQHGRAYELDLRIRRADGSTGWIATKGQPTRNEQGAVMRLFGTVLDITDRKHAEEQLQHLSDRLTLALKAGEIGTWDWDLIHEAAWDTRMYELYGFQRLGRGVTYQDWANALHPDDRVHFEAAFQAAAQEGKNLDMEFRILRPDGTLRFIKALALVQENLQGEPQRVVGINYDITDRKQIEAELERRVDERTAELQQAYRRLTFHIANSPLAVIEWDADFRVNLWSRRAEQIFGWWRSEVMGKRVVDWPFVHENDLPGVEQMLSDMLSSQKVFNTYFNRNYTKTGEVVYCEWYNSLFRNDDGEVISMLSLVQDVTARCESEEALRQANETLEQRVEERTRDLAELTVALQRSNQELEQFAYIASHDLQEPLRTITSYTQLFARKYQGHLDEKAEKYIYYVVDGTARMQQLIRDVLSYSRTGRQELKLEHLDCNSLVEEVKKNLQAAIIETQGVIHFESLPTLIGDHTQLLLLFQNLIGNALKYRSSAPPQVEISATQQAQYWQFAITDNGIGIESQYVDRIFAIFQRLHARTEYPGTGLGLAIAKKIIERHHGTIWVESEPGRGSTFYFTLPMQLTDGTFAKPGSDGHPPG